MLLKVGILLCFYLIFVILIEADNESFPAEPCPETNGEEPELIPDRRDCSKFYICDNGQAWSQNCSGGLYFNPTLEVCDRPENVVYCEYDDFIYIKPHCNCSKYVICNYGSVEVRDCAQGYHFKERSAKLAFSYNPCEEGDC